MTLTEKDIDEIESLIDAKFDERLKFLPSKDDFFGWMDKLMKEFEKIRQEMAFSSKQLDDHEDRITSLEEIHPQGQHQTL